MTNYQSNSVQQLKGTTWRGRGTALGYRRVYNEELTLKFLTKNTSSANGYAIEAEWAVYNQSTRQLIVKGRESYVGFMFVDGYIHGSRVRPQESGYIRIKILPNGKLEYGFNESGPSPHSCSVYAILNQIN